MSLIFDSETEAISSDGGNLTIEGTALSSLGGGIAGVDIKSNYTTVSETTIINFSNDFSVNATGSGYQEAYISLAAGGPPPAFSSIGSYAAYQGASVNAGAGSNIGSLAQGTYATASGDKGSFAQGTTVTSSGNYGSFAQGYGAVASGSNGCFSQGRTVNATANTGCFSQGLSARSSANFGSFSQGQSVTASGSRGSFIQGYSGTASGSMGSFAQGRNIKATGMSGSFAQGFGTTASGSYGSFAQGNATASGHNGSFAQGSAVTASGSNGSFAQGKAAVASAPNGSLARGTAATAGGGYGPAFAQGLSVTATGGQGSFAFGNNVTATATNSWATGIYAVADKLGQRTVSQGRFSANGDAQSSQMIVFVQTTDGSATSLTLNGGAESSENRLTIPNNTSWAFEVLIVARNTATDGENAVFKLFGGIKKDGTAGTTALIGAVDQTVKSSGGGSAAWSITAAADTTNGALRLQATGEASHTINWVGTIKLTEVAG